MPVLQAVVEHAAVEGVVVAPILLLEVTVAMIVGPLIGRDVANDHVELHVCVVRSVAYKTIASHQFGEREREREKPHHERDLEEATDEEYSEEENAHKYPPIHSLFTNQLLQEVDGEETTPTKDKEKDGEENPAEEKQWK